MHGLQGRRTKSEAGASTGSTSGDVCAHGRARAGRPAAAHAARGPAERGRGRAVHHAGAVLPEQAVGGHGLAAHAQARLPLEQRVQRERAACARTAVRLRRSAGVCGSLHTPGAPLKGLGAWACAHVRRAAGARGDVRAAGSGSLASTVRDRRPSKMKFPGVGCAHPAHCRLRAAQ